MPIPFKLGSGAPYAIRGTTALRLANVGGVVFAGGTLTTNRVFDATLGTLNWPYLGLRSGKSDNGPYPNSVFLNGGMVKAVSAGKFGLMVAGQYVIMSFCTQLAGVASTTLSFTGTMGTKSMNRKLAFVNTKKIVSTGGWYYVDGSPVNPTPSRDSIGLETYPGTRSIPGRAVYMSGSLTPTATNFPAKTD